MPLPGMINNTRVSELIFFVHLRRPWPQFGAILSSIKS